MPRVLPFTSRRSIQIWLILGVLGTTFLWFFILVREDDRSVLPEIIQTVQTNQDRTIEKTRDNDEKKEDQMQTKETKVDEDLMQTETKSLVKIEENLSTNAKPSPKVITFYYPWYGNPEVNGAWMHWNHKVLIKDGSFYEPPDSIGADFYPQLGPYSSADPIVIDQHLKWMAESRIGVLCTSWWGKANSDGQLSKSSGYTDKLVKMLLDSAAKYGLQVTVHLEPYEGRGAASVKEDLIYIIEQYGDHPALYRDPTRGNRPVVFFYDSYLTPAEEWATILSPQGSNTIRGTNYDAIMIGLYVNDNDKRLLVNGKFDGFYTYFATDGFTQGSTTSNWPSLSNWATSNDLLFLPCVGPGYADVRIRPWNHQNQRDRRQGLYYDEMFKKAVDLNPPFIGITSFNEWHEGTQIEPSVSKQLSDYKYFDFAPLEPDYYLKKTKEWVDVYDPS